jgi:adenylyltransferase/sulfurtransferase
MQAMETIKLILGVGDSLAGRLLLFDALAMTWREISVRRNPDCPVCGDHPTQTGLMDYEVFCGVTPMTADPIPDGAHVILDEDERRPAPGTVGEMDARELADRLGSGTPPYVLDVREEWEWAVSNLGGKGAVLIPETALPERVAEVPVDRPVVVVCRAGVRSLRAAHVLAAAGVREVYNLREGMRGWVRDVDPDLPVA